MNPADDGPDDQGFLTRWSRRKRLVAEQETVLVAAQPQAALPATTEAEAAAPEPEMVEPPSLDLVDKDFDVAHWLKQNVPDSWKLAALRRAWETDPAIAGFENPARDYALDWNTPGGAPGYGPLTESDDVAAMVRGIFGDPPPEAPAAVAEATGDSMSHQLSLSGDDPDRHAAMQQSPAPESVRLTAEDDSGAEYGPDAAEPSGDAFAAAQNNPAAGVETARIRTRGGGATPV